eukprot:scaffold16305_cov124-Isochrysis_galbana.AAC.6
MAPPTYASAMTGDFLGVPPSPKRPREDNLPHPETITVRARDHDPTVIYGLRPTAVYGAT